LGLSSRTAGTFGGNLFSDTAGGASTLQVGYAKGPWKLGAAWTYSNATVGVNGSTPLAASAIPSLLQRDGFYNGFGLAGSWDPKKASLIPSISAGAGINFRAPRKINKALDSGMISFMIG